MHECLGSSSVEAALDDDWKEEVSQLLVVYQFLKYTSCIV